MRRFGFILLIWAVVFGILETQYFGNNLLPESSEELLCDITSLMLCCAGLIILLLTAKKVRI